MTDVGIRASAFEPQHSVALGRQDAWYGTAAPVSSRLLLWDLALAALAAVVLTVGWPIAPVAVVVVLVGCWGGCLTLTGATRSSLIDSRAQELGRVVRAGCAFAFAGSALSLVPQASLTAGQAFAAAAACTAMSCGVRAATRTRGRADGCVLVVGGVAEREHAVAALSRRRGPALEIVTACLAPAGRLSPPGEIAVSVEELPAFARYVGARSVVAVPGAGLDALELRRLRWLLEEERVPCYVTTALLGVAPGRVATVDVAGVPLVRADTGRRSGVLWVLGDWCGRFLAALALLFLAPLLLAIVVAIRRDSPGPAIFRQTRVGQDGRLFTIYKLRTMVDESRLEAALVNDCDGVLFKMRSDPRITPLGRWLRKFSLDELPQLVNVARGQMRLVGPRPALPEEVAEYSEDERRRLAMPPGITGLWQISGRSDLTWEESVRLDLHYVDNWSAATDLLIICQTFRAVLGHRGAY
jgi:exopolysaccharide biosynthesis polyprenyl glycosylphosphotransferase